MNKLSETLKKLVKGGFFSILISGAMAKMVAFLSSIVIVRLVDKTSYAALAYADNLYSYIFLLSGLGMASAILKYAVNEKEEINKAYYLFALKWGTLVQGIFLCGIIMIAMIFPLPFPEAKKIMIYLLPYGMLYYWFSILQSYFRTQFENQKYAVANFLQVLLTFLLSFILVKVIGILGITYARALSYVCTIAIFVPFIYKYYKRIPSYNLSKTEIRPFVIMSLSLLISNVFSMVMPANESFLINNMIKDEIVSANYKVANLIPSQLPFITSTIMVYYFPIYAKKSNDRFVWNSIKKLGFFTFILNLCISGIGAVLTPFIVNIVYGSAYKDAISLSTILWFVYLLNAGFRMIPMNILPALGHVKFNMVLSICSAIVHVVVDYYFINKYGIHGAVFATAIVYIISGLLYWTYLYKKCKEIK